MSPEALPPFVLGDSEDDRLFVIHLLSPRFVAEVMEHEDGSFDLTPHWLDPAPANAEELLQTAADFYLRMLEWEEEDERTEPGPDVY